MKRRVIVVAALVVLGLGGLAYWLGWTGPLVARATAALGIAPHPDETAGTRKPPAPETAKLAADGRLLIPTSQQEAIGLEIARVVPQTEPIRIELLGTTAYDPDTLTKIRPRFDALVRKVAVTLGQHVQAGDPLVVLDSAALAEAKTAYQTAQTQWEHDKHLLQTRGPLAKSGAISQQVWADTQNSEIQSRLAAKVALDKLLVYGLTAEQVKAAASEDDAAKAQMTMLAPAAGVVVTRDVAPGNVYDPTDILLVIAPLDHLWIWGNVFESELDLVRVGQSWQVRFPYLNESVPGEVVYVGDQVDPTTHAVRIRGTIANPEGRLKANMLVSTLLEVPPLAGRTVIPRLALVTTDGADLVYVRSADNPEAFERREVSVAQERAEYVVVARGLKPGETVATHGSLVVAEIDQDRRMVEAPAPDASTAAAAGPPAPDTSPPAATSGAVEGL